MNAGDEFYNKNILNNLSKFCYKNKDRDIIFGDTVINNSYMKYKAVSNYFDKNILLMPFCHQSSIVKSHIMKKFLFNTNYYLSADFDFFFIIVTLIMQII